MPIPIIKLTQSNSLFGPQAPSDVGDIVEYTGATPPAGWMLCNGASLPTAAYPALFAQIGYTYGGSGANFNLPSESAFTVNPTQDGLSPGMYNRFQIGDHFLYPIGDQSTPLSVGTLVTVYPIPWYFFIVGTGAQVLASNGTAYGQDPFNQAHGIWMLYTGSTSTGSASIYSQWGFGGGLTGLIPGLGALNLYFRVAFSTPSTVAQQYVSFFGITASAPSSSVNQIAIATSTSGSTPIWLGQNYGNSVVADTAFSSTPTIVAQSSTALTYYKLQISINATWTAISYYVNGVLLGTNTTGIPTFANTGVAGLAPFITITKSVGTTAVFILIDQFFLDYAYSV
jgi:hypothetical protein